MRAMSTSAPFQNAWAAMESTSTDPRYVGPTPRLAAEPVDHDVFANIAAMTSNLPRNARPRQAVPTPRQLDPTPTGNGSSAPEDPYRDGANTCQERRPDPSTRSHKISTELQAGDAQVISTRRTAHIHQDEDRKSETHPDVQKDARSCEINIAGIGDTERAQG